MEMSPEGYNVCRSFEGRALRAYKDVVGVWTIGFGNTNADAEVLGFIIGPGVTITEAQANDLLKVAMETRYEPTVRAVLGEVPQYVFDAACDFVYNIGTAGLAGRSWVKAWLARGDASGILAYDHAGGKVYPGLTRRRHREFDMITAGNYGPEGVQPPALLDSVPIPASTNMLWRGALGQEVTDFQTALGINGFPCPVSGTYDPATEAACKQFQAAHPQLAVDGVAGPATRAAAQRGVDMRSKGKRAGGAFLLSGGAISADHAVQAAPILPAWGVAALGVAFLVTVAFMAWQYRDELKAMFHEH